MNAQNAFFVAPSSYCASLESVSDQAWYADSDASSHVTNDPNQLFNRSYFAGNDRLTIGNGFALHVSHIGSIKSNRLHHKLLFPDALCVPHTTKNLLCISKLTNDNPIFVEFYSNLCFIKDL
ncbi:hypothetical protein Scep_001425 [Stephania cephalantha]|uniref:Retrovirus-related Pol polyprotein from transposon TNT 1-94-like beta-barrel domain-containing protein n=1 Tax=Stephania cephalantha TaxID=152367 RepID=A0AAP0LBR1_9MAGN